MAKLIVFWSADFSAHSSKKATTFSTALRRPSDNEAESERRRDLALRAVAARPAYIAIGPVFATPTKPGAVPVTLDYVRWAAANIQIPWFAIGGINPDNLAQVLQAGATRICAVTAILNAPDPAEACRQFLRHFPAAQ